MSIVRVPFSLTGGGAAAYVPAGAIWLDGAADYLSWTPSGAGASTTDGIFSCWVKLSKVDYSSTPALLRAGSMAGTYNYLHMTTAERWGIDKFTNPSTTGMYRQSDGIYRDPTAWAHICMSLSTSDGTADDRFHLYVNGVREDGNSVTTPSSGEAIIFASAVAHYIGLGNGYFDGYLADAVYLDGKSIQAGDYAITDFVDTDDNGNPIPVDPSGLTFGTNGFWLNFADSADLGNDVSGNNNDFTPTSMSAANSTNDRPADDATADPVEGNYCTWNPLAMNSSPTVSEGNLKIAGNSATNYRAVPTIIPSSGKWHYEWQWQSPTIAAGMFIGVEASRATNYIASVSQPGATSTSWGASTENSTTLRVYHNSSYNDRTIPFTFVQNDYIVCDFDVDAGDIWLGVHDVSGGTTYWVNGSGTFTSTFPSGSPTYSGVTMADGVLFPAVGIYTSTYYGKANFGQNTFVSSQPTDFKALNTANLPAPTVTDPSAYFNTVLYTGNGTAIGSGGKAVTGVGFQPDLVWIKNRDATDSHLIFEVISGATKYIQTDDTTPDTGNNPAQATDTESLSTFNSDGFTLGNNVEVNTNTENYVAWCMKFGGTGSSNGTGSIPSTVSVAAHGGASLIQHTGTGANNTVGHGMSIAPALMIHKNLDTANNQLITYFDRLSTPATDYMLLNRSVAKQTGGTSFWNSTVPTSSVFSVGTNASTNNSGDTILTLAFARTPGLIGIGSYVGNGSADGPYVVVDDGGSGFRPAFLLVKNINNGTASWGIWDSVRNPYNLVNRLLFPNLTNGENTSTTNTYDFTANGFKVRSTGANNSLNQTIIYLAFAEYPFGGEGVAQAKAR